MHRLKKLGFFSPLHLAWCPFLYDKIIKNMMVPAKTPYVGRL